MLTDDETMIAGYYTIGTGSLDFVDHGKREKAGGSIHISHFALDERFQHQPYAETIQGNSIYISDFCFSIAFQQSMSCVVPLGLHLLLYALQNKGESYTVGTLLKC